MAEFQLVTVWQIEAPIEQVCDAVSDCLNWPKWWRGVEKVEELELGDPGGVGSLRRFTWKGRLPYRLTFDVRVTRIVPLTELEGLASGEVEGVGRWHFTSDGAVTQVHYEWRVHTNRAWMNIIAAIAKPLLKWNHDLIMRQGAEGMARLLSARLVSIEHR